MSKQEAVTKSEDGVEGEVDIKALQDWFTAVGERKYGKPAVEMRAQDQGGEMKPEVERAVLDLAKLLYGTADLWTFLDILTDETRGRVMQQIEEWRRQSRLE
jgi:hypothetical protein